MVTSSATRSSSEATIPHKLRVRARERVEDERWRKAIDVLAEGLLRHGTLTESEARDMICESTGTLRFGDLPSAKMITQVLRRAQKSRISIRTS
jgi:hypothetical protein